MAEFNYKMVLGLKCDSPDCSHKVKVKDGLKGGNCPFVKFGNNFGGDYESEQTIDKGVGSVYDEFRMNVGSNSMDYVRDHFLVNLPKGVCGHNILIYEITKEARTDVEKRVRELATGIGLTVTDFYTETFA